MISVLDLKAEYNALKTEVDAAIRRVLESGVFVGGPEVEMFESELKAYLGVKHAVSVGSGTDALFIALRALGVGPGDEVIAPAFTFIATIEAILHAGAKPVLVDIDQETFNLDPAGLEGAVSPKTRAVLPVHLYGQPAPMSEISSFAAKHNLKVVEDAAQAIGARYCYPGSPRPNQLQADPGVAVGTLGHAAAFSFYPTKNLAAYGDGGLVATNDDSLAEKARMLAVHGAKTRYHHELAAGYTSRLDALQAAILRAKLPQLESWNAKRRRTAKAYTESLSELVFTPVVASYSLHTFHQYTIRTPERDRLIAHLKHKGVGSSIHYPLPVHLQPAYTHLGSPGQFPHAEKAAREVLSLPMHPFLTDEQAEYIGSAVRSFFG